MGTRYFKSTGGTFAVTLLKKYRRYFIRYIFEKVPTVPVLGTDGTVIRYFLKEKFCTFWKQYFRWFHALNNDWVSYLRMMVTGRACSANESTGKTTSKKSNLHYTSDITYYAQTCNEFAGPFATTLSLVNTVPMILMISQLWCYWRLLARVLIFNRFTCFWPEGYQHGNLGKSHENGDHLKPRNAKKLS